MGSDYSASVSSFPLSSRLRLTAAPPVRPLRFRFLGFPRSLRPGFPCLPSRFFVLGFLFVSFRPSLIRSHSCSSGACFRIFRFPSDSFRPRPFHFRLLSATVLPFSSLPVFASSGSSGAPGFFRPSGLSPSFLIRFPTVPSGSAYLAFCWFPFVLPCFTPAAVRQVLTSRSHSRCFSVTFAFFRPLPF